MSVALNYESVAVEKSFSLTIQTTNVPIHRCCEIMQRPRQEDGSVRRKCCKIIGEAAHLCDRIRRAPLLLASILE